MKAFYCRDFGHQCNEILRARTDELLSDMISVHLREFHGVTQLTSEDIASYKKMFRTEASRDAAGVVDRIFEQYNCDSEPACTWRFISEAEMILTGNRNAHVQELKAA